MSHSKISDAAMTITASVLAALGSLVTEEQKALVFQEVYARVRSGLIAYEEQADRMHKRLHPLEAEN